MPDAPNPALVFFGRELQRKRTALDLTQEQLAERLGCSSTWISRMEVGRKISKDSAIDLDTFFKTDGIFLRMWELSKEIEPGMAEHLLAERLSRQALLAKEKPPRCFFIMDEMALRRKVGDEKLMREQYKNLLDVARLPSVTIYVINEGTGYYPGLTGAFTVIGLDDGSHVAYTESAGSGMLISERARAAKYLLRYETIAGYALPISESLALIRRLLEEL
ncbi:helix-turn-helix domain-containing protein [Actinomadura rupiterrae]|uniref:helix-turn-helix domain-containing protein n=1 Tax=Actinomadura rupiterrae TaxID=559627 RepID=UPI0020A58894|nr:helix-turn-helix transcriptional regulator [Actinomadura rupiterrae]MCP2343061.1 transcriptional regulator with XRE-family HTH domain [Actinomadura rupiterrae]